MIGKGATPSFFAIANYNYTLTFMMVCVMLFEKVNSILVWILLFPYTTSLTMDFTDSMIKIYIGLVHD